MTSSADPQLRKALDTVHAKFDHAAIAVPRIRDALPLYVDLLGGQFARGGDNPRVGYRGIQLSYGDHLVEILEPHPNSTFLDSFLSKNPLGGLHHLTFKVDSLETAIASIEKAGYTVHGAFTDDTEWQEVFIHPKRALGTLVQIACEGPNFLRTVDFGIDDVLSGRGNRGTGIPSP
ncbi:MAG: VOC family protein [Nostocoides sp.]